MNNTLAVVKKMKEDIIKIFYWTTILVQIIFIIFYGYSIYKNIERIHFLIIYCVLAILSLIHFIYFLSTNNKENKKLVRRVKRIFRVSKYIVNGTMVGVNTYEMIKYGCTDFNKILLIVSGISLLVQIIMELIRIFMDRYIDLFTCSLSMDFKPFIALSKANEVKGNFYTMIDAPLEKLANKIEGKTETKVLSKDEQYIEDLKSQYIEEKQQNKKEKKAAAKERSNAKAQEQKEEIKEHLQVIKKSILKKKSK